MRKAIITIAALFIAIQFARVAAFASGPMHAGVLGIVFSLALSCGVFACAYWTRVSAAGKDGIEKRVSTTARSIAWLSLIFVAVVDGFFNELEVLRTTQATPIYQVGAVVYGAFPTLAAAILGRLQGAIDRIPKLPARDNRWRQLVRKAGDVVYARLEKRLDAAAENKKPVKFSELGTRDKVLALFLDQPEMSFTSAAGKVGVSRQQVSNLYWALIDDGLLSKNGKKRGM